MTYGLKFNFLQNVKAISNEVKTFKYLLSGYDSVDDTIIFPKPKSDFKCQNPKNFGL